MFLQNANRHDDAPATVEEAEERFLDLLRLAAETPLAPKPEIAHGESGFASVVGQMNMWHVTAHGTLCAAYTLIFNKPVPDELLLKDDKSIFGELK
jgi:hypothetical protein